MSQGEIQEIIRSNPKAGPKPIDIRLFQVPAALVTPPSKQIETPPPQRPRGGKRVVLRRRLSKLEILITCAKSNNDTAQKVKFIKERDAIRLQFKAHYKGLRQKAKARRRQERLKGIPKQDVLHLPNYEVWKSQFAPVDHSR